MILLLDNYDSFVHNLARHLVRLGQEVLVVRSDALSVDQVFQRKPAAIVLSPGPCGPLDAGICVPLVRTLDEHWSRTKSIPLLGICLGHQAIGAAFGLPVRRHAPCHGVASWIYHDGLNEFEGLENPQQVGRYHSLIVELPPQDHVLSVSCWTEDGTVMGLRHKAWPCLGWQFHPESILTPQGYGMLEGFLRLSGMQANVCDSMDEGCRKKIAQPTDLPSPDETDIWPLPHKVRT